MIQDRLNEWTMELADGAEIQSVNEHVEHLAEELYVEYEPTKGPYPDFWQRLESWLDNVSEMEQKVLFKSLKHLFFIGDRELDNLYRVAYNEAVPMWLMDILGLRLDDTNLSSRLVDGLRSTWFCPLTDSMRINAFYHLNHVSGFNHRPDWSSLCELGSDAKIDKYMTDEGIERIVLLEDFVGSGSQIEDAVRYAASLPGGRPVLVVPLVLCPIGIPLLDSMVTTYSNLKYKAILTLHRFDFLGSAPVTNEPSLYASLRTIATTAYNQIQKSGPHNQLYGPFGFADTGGLVVLSTNCPDNALPYLHFNCATWNALFPRASRL